MMRLILIALMAVGSADGFSPIIIQQTTKGRGHHADSTTSSLFSTDTSADVTVSVVEPKEAVKLFGRLAEKYIMLDESGGMCCYSGCTDCEYRLPGGGYRMADQSASRPKWIPVYEERSFASQNKEHVSKWSTDIFTNGPAVTKEEFVSAMVEMAFAPPLGGPYVSASAGKIEDPAAAEALFDLLADGKEKLARHKMSVCLKKLADGDQGLTWPAFSAALGL
jgi:hypothetical protein